MLYEVTADPNDGSSYVNFIKLHLIAFKTAAILDLPYIL